VDVPAFDGLAETVPSGAPVVARGAGAQD